MSPETSATPSAKEGNHILGWVFGIIFLLMSLAYVFSSVIAGFAMLLLGLLLLPPSRKWFEKKINRKVSRLAAFGIGTVLFIVAMVAYPTHSASTNQIAQDNTKNTNSVATNVAAANTNTVPQLTAEEQTAKDQADADAKKSAEEAAAKKDAEDKAAQEALAKPHFDDGTFVVGTDIQPGTYRTHQGSSGCYYSRLSGFGGSLDEIISNENTDAPAVVTIADSDKGFESSNCGTWTQDLSAITTDQTSFEDGTYIVGTDIEAGTYKSSGSDGCYYSRLKGFSGSLGDIISNQNTDTAAIVTIASSDKGFTATRCGTWTKQ